VGFATSRLLELQLWSNQQGAIMDNRELVLAFLEAFGTFEPDKFVHFMTDDPTWRVFQSERRGRQAIAELAAIAAGLYPTGAAREIQAVVSEGDRVVVQSILRAVTNKGENYENYYVLIFELRDGRIDTVWEYLNSAYAQSKFLLPGAPAANR
jgi:ketosteroid isomerase-like protein